MATQILALIGVISGLASLGWNIWTWHKGRRLDLRLAVRVHMSEDPKDWEVCCHVANKNGQAIYIKSVRILQADLRHCYVDLTPSQVCGNSGIIEPLSECVYSRSGELAASKLGGFEHAVIEASTADGSTFTADIRKNRTFQHDCFLAALIADGLVSAKAGQGGDDEPNHLLTEESFMALAGEKYLHWQLQAMADRGLIDVRETEGINEYKITEYGKEALNSGAFVPIYQGSEAEIFNEHFGGRQRGRAKVGSIIFRMLNRLVR